MRRNVVLTSVILLFTFVNAIASVPTFKGYTLDVDNKYIDITFSEGVFSAGGGPLDATAFNLFFTKNPLGNASSVTILSLQKVVGGSLVGGESIIRFNLSVTDTPTGAETIEIFPLTAQVRNSTGTFMDGTVSSGLINLNPGYCSPSNQFPIDNLRLTAYSIGTIDLSWDNNGDEVVLVATESAPLTPNAYPMDGSFYTYDQSFQNSTEAIGNGLVVYVGSNNSVTITGLTDGKTYYFTAFRKENECYYELQAPTLAVNTGVIALANGDASSSISSNTIDPLRAEAMSFTLSNFTGNDFQFGQITFQIAAESDIVDLTQYIEGAELSNDNGGSPADHNPAVINSNKIDIFGIQNTSAGDLGFIPDNKAVNYSLKVWLKSPLPSSTTGKSLIFDLQGSDIISINTILVEDIMIKSSDKGNLNSFEVKASKLVFAMEPSSNYLVGIADVGPILEALDDAGNIDKNFNESVVYSTIGDNIQPSGTAIFTNGRLDLEADQITFGAVGVGNLVVTATPSNFSATSSTSVTVDGPPVMINNVQIGNNTVQIIDLSQRVTIIYNQEMNPSTEPLIGFLNSSKFSKLGSSWSSTTYNNDTYTIDFVHDGTFESVPFEEVQQPTPSGVKSIYGTDDNSTISSPIFAINVNPPPIILPDIMTLSYNTSSPETIVFTLSEEINVAEGGNVTGFSTTMGTIGTARYSGKGTTNTITLTSSADGVWNNSVRVNYASGPGNVKDLGNVTLASFTNHPVVANCVQPIINTNPTDRSTCSGDAVTFSVNVTAVSPGYQWYISNDNVTFSVLNNGAIYSGVTTAVLTINNSTGLDGKYYRVTVKEGGNCDVISSSAKLSLIAESININVGTANTPNTACDPSLYNGSITLTVNNGGVGPFTYTFIGPSSTESFSGRPASYTYSNAEPGDYTMEVTNEATSCKTVTSTNILDNIQVPVFSTNSTPNTSCTPNNGSISLSTGDGTVEADYTIIWYVGTVSAGNIITGESGFNINNLAPDTYYYEAKRNATGCVTPPNAVMISDLTTAPVLAISSTADNSCSNDVGTIAVSVSPSSSTYLFEYFSASILQNSASAVGSNTFTGVTEGSYDVKVTDTSTGCFTIQQTTVLGPNPPTSASISKVGSVAICSGDSEQLRVSITGGTAPFTIGIDNGVGTISSYNSGDPIIVNPTATTTYKVTSITDANGCNITTLPSVGVTVNVNAVPSAPTSLSFSSITETSMKITWTSGSGAGRLVVITQGTSMTSFPVNGTGYIANTVFGQGTDLGNGHFTIFKGAGTFMTVTGLSKGLDYTVSVYEFNGNCYSATAVTKTQKTAGCATVPTLTATPNSQTICSGEATSIGLTSSSNGASFNWVIASSSNVTGMADGTGSTINQNLTSTSSAGGTVTYQVTATNGACVSNPIQVVITVAAQPTLFDVTGGGGICEGSSNSSSVILSGSQNGVTYQLFVDGSPVSTLSGNGSSLTFSGIGTIGTYTVSATNTNNCSSDMNGSAVVYQDLLPVLSGSITGNSSVCLEELGISYSVSDPGNVTFDWTLPTGFTIVSGDGTSDISVDISASASAGDISVFATNSCGNSSTISIPVSVNAGFSATIETDAEIWVNRDTPFLVNTTANVASVNWDFGDGGSSTGTSTTHNYKNIGNYTVDADVTADGCSKIISLSITVVESAKVIIKNVITPNADGLNDFLFIENIEFYPGSEVVILDRWGKELISFSDYQNDWDGIINGEVISAGNYICLVKLSEGDVYSMTVTVIK